MAHRPRNRLRCMLLGSEICFFHAITLAFYIQSFSVYSPSTSYLQRGVVRFSFLFEEHQMVSK